MEFISIITSIIRLVPELIILGFCIKYATTIKSPDGILMIIGTVIGIALSAFFTALPYIDYTELYSDQSLMVVLSIIGFAGQVCFVIGLVILINKMIARSGFSTTAAGVKNNPEGPLDAGM